MGVILGMTPEAVIFFLLQSAQTATAMRGGDKGSSTKGPDAAQSQLETKGDMTHV